MFEIGENLLRNVLAIMLLAIGVVGVGLAIAQYVQRRNVAQSVGMLAGAILLIVVGGGIYWIAGTFSDDISPNITQTVDPSDLVTDYKWGQQTGGGSGTPAPASGN